jgi:hypothetical protein
MRYDRYGSRRRVRFYVRRPSGYMSPYPWRGVLHDRLNARRHERGRYDPVFASVLGSRPLRVPMLPYRN